MGAMTRFFEYAQDFEKTYLDDDWSRLERHLAPDAVYEVRNGPFACRIQGRDAIFRGIKKSLDGFDRRFPERKPEITSPPLEDGERVSVGWLVTYVKPGAPPFLLRGRSEARVADDRIVELVDSYPDDIGPAATAWVREYAPDFDASYV